MTRRPCLATFSTARRLVTCSNTSSNIWKYLDFGILDILNSDFGWFCTSIRNFCRTLAKPGWFELGHWVWKSDVGNLTAPPSPWLCDILWSCECVGLLCLCVWQYSGFNFQTHFSLVFHFSNMCFNFFTPAQKVPPLHWDVHPTGLRPFSTQPCRCISYGGSCIDSIVEVQAAIQRRVTPGMPGWNESKQVCPQKFGTRTISSHRCSSTR